MSYQKSATGNRPADVPLKKIIVATDFSAEADNAVLFAAQAAAEHQLEIILFTLYQVSVHALNARSSPETLNQMLERYHARLESVAAKLRREYNIAASAVTASGDFYEEIEKCIIENEAGLVVMGMAGKSLEQDLLGNTTTAAIHLLKFPVIAIPADAVYKGIRKIMFACDITRGIHARILERVKVVAETFGSSVEVFHVSRKMTGSSDEKRHPSDLEVIGRGMSGIDYSFKNSVAEGVISAIREEIDNAGIDLLIMVPHKYGFWNSLVHRSKTRIMASGSKIPLLSLPL